ncbi:MAG TPA: efflux RND transporter periplasmic adaptor subunit [Planctomycetota bacterium]|nr:efflux RND transporter periplasmic adaptor subunit [Planctomycetota bacterium]
MKLSGLFPVTVAMVLACTPLCAQDNAVRMPVPPGGFEVMVVGPTDVELRTNATGSLRPRERTVVPSPISGKVAWVIEEGTRVTQGLEVARVDCTEYAEGLQRQKLELAAVEAELQRAKYEAQLVTEQLGFEVKKAQLNLELTRLKRSVLGPPTHTDEALSRLTVEQTKYAMDAAEKEYDRFKQLGEKGIQSGRTIALARLKYERARADYLRAKTDHELLLKGDPKEDIAVADQEVRRAEIALRLAKQRLESQSAFQATQVRVAEVGVERFKAQIDLLQGRIDRSRVVAPVDGVVYYPRHWGMPLREGDPVWQSNRLLDVADPSVMTVDAVVNQVDWPRVKPGQKVDVRLVAYPDELFHGVVQQVGVLARDRSLILREEVANVMSFNILVDVQEQSPKLRPSYTAKISITTDRFENCIAVPRRAVVRRDTTDFLWVSEDGRPVLRRVTLGPADAVNVVVEKGLKLGDEVLIPRRTSPEKA